MRVIIAGSRTISRYAAVEKAVIKSGFSIDVVISGGARGVDRLGELWARRNGIPVRRFPAAWGRYGKKAGYLRNERMARCGEGLIAVWDGQSPGTSQMIEIAKTKGLKVFVQIPNGKADKRPLSAKILYDRGFYPDSGNEEARAVIVDYSDSRHIAFRYGITERPPGGKEVVTFQGKLEEASADLPEAVWRSLRQDLLNEAKSELEREIRIATDPHYDLPVREIY